MRRRNKATKARDRHGRRNPVTDAQPPHRPVPCVYDLNQLLSTMPYRLSYAAADEPRCTICGHRLSNTTLIWRNCPDAQLPLVACYHCGLSLMLWAGCPPEKHIHAALEALWPHRTPRRPTRRLLPDTPKTHRPPRDEA